VRELGSGSSRVLLKIALTIIGVFVAVSIVYPLIYIVAQAVLAREEILTDLSDLWKYGVTLEKFKSILGNWEFYEALRNTLIVAFMSIILAVAVIIPAAYGFSRFEFLGKNTMLYIYLIVSQAGGGFGVIAILALYIFMLRLSAYGISLFHLYVLPFIYVAGMVPFQTWLMKSYFDQLPRELDEAAFIDGASWSDIIFKIVLPASKSSFIIIALFAFMGAWGEFIIADILGLNTLGRFIYRVAMGPVGIDNPSTYAASSIIYAVPIVLLFVIAQKYIGEAYRRGIVKG
jgi:arabinogalactan oligomer/maltooligosaccharide transport system permease protein